eukprot:s252_g8.t1
MPPTLCCAETAEDQAGCLDVLARRHEEILHRLDSQEELLLRLTHPNAAQVGRVRSNMDEMNGLQGTSGPGRPWASIAVAEFTPSHTQSSQLHSSELSMQNSIAMGPIRKPRLFTTFEQKESERREEAASAEWRRVTGVQQQPAEEETLSFAQRIVQYPYFDIFFAAVVITNSLFIGFEVSMADPVNDTLLTRPVWIQTIQYTYTALFTGELILRIWAGGKHFFCSKEWPWVPAPSPEDLDRIFRFVLALRTLITSITHTLKSLIWALILLALIMYIFALMFVQAVQGYLADPESAPICGSFIHSTNLVSESDEDRANSYFGSLIETMLSLFMSISDGVSWENVISPLLHISPVWGILYTFYVSFIYFAVLNAESHLEKIRILFSELGDERNDVITYAMLERKMMADETQRYFESLGLEIWDVWTFFKLLDHDQDGNVHLEQFLSLGEAMDGCLRLRGQASSVDVARLIHDQTWLISAQGNFQSFMETELRSLRQELRALKAASPGPSRSSRALDLASTIPARAALMTSTVRKIAGLPRPLSASLAPIRKRRTSAAVHHRFRLEDLPGTLGTADLLEGHIRALLRRVGAPRPDVLDIPVDPIRQKAKGIAYLEYADAAAAEPWHKA